MSAAAVRAAARRLRPHLAETPLEASPFLSEATGVPVRLKLECFQPTRSFKVRGAFNALLALGPSVREARVVGASAGNHGLGLALAAEALGARAILYVPAGAPETKVRRIRELGAEVRLVEGSYDDAEARAMERAMAGEGLLVHPFDDDEVVAGQGTAGLEITARWSEVEEVVVPVGGGGLLAGVGVALGAPGERRVWGVQSQRTRAMHDAFAAGRSVPTEVVPTLADGLAGGVTEGSYRRARAVTDEVRLVAEEGIADAVRALYRHHGVVAEGSAAVAVAALLEGVVAPRGPTAVIVTGGNMDGERLARILAGGAD
ncbi:MAG TPA: pyridoxal-phosphate dependent enzyme [Longimicrobiales bacterium]|nr:pyridoxal-phosphate dependent enzyme [Longimicrobiales bacterium]